jgi:preprotein translocase YajC subunit
VPLVGIVAVFYFLLIRPQQKQAKKHKDLASLRKGDQVVTQSGLFGKIYSISDKEVVLEVGGGTKSPLAQEPDRRGREGRDRDRRRAPTRPRRRSKR